MESNANSGIGRKMQQCVWKTSRLVLPSHQPLWDEGDKDNPFLSEITHTYSICTHTHNSPKHTRPSPGLSCCTMISTVNPYVV